jgi:hypothetical protein
VFAAEAELSGTFLVYAKRIGGDDCEAIDVRTMKIWHVDGGHDVT